MTAFCPMTFDDNDFENRITGIVGWTIVEAPFISTAAIQSALCMAMRTDHMKKTAQALNELIVKLLPVAWLGCLKRNIRTYNDCHRDTCPTGPGERVESSG